MVCGGGVATSPRCASGVHFGCTHKVSLRNIVLVVAVLIATATFQAILNPPGGVGGGSDNYVLPNGTHINATISSTNHIIPFSNISHIMCSFPPTILLTEFQSKTKMEMVLVTDVSSTISIC